MNSEIAEISQEPEGSMTNEEERKAGNVLVRYIKAMTIHHLSKLPAPDIEMGLKNDAGGRSRRQNYRLLETTATWKGTKGQIVMRDSERIESLGSPAGKQLSGEFESTNLPERVFRIEGKEAYVSLHLYFDGSWSCMCEQKGAYYPIATSSFRRNQENPPIRERAGQLISSKGDFFDLITAKNPGGQKLNQALTAILEI